MSFPKLKHEVICNGCGNVIDGVFVTGRSKKTPTASLVCFNCHADFATRPALAPGEDPALALASARDAVLEEQSAPTNLLLSEKE